MKLIMGSNTLLSVAVAALIGVSGTAFAQSTSVNLTKDYSEDVDVDYDNNVSIDINKEVDVSKDVNYVGTVVISGNLNVSEAAMSVIDNKQIIDDNYVDVRGSDETLTNITTVDGLVLSTATGNVGLNVSVGDSILQENAATLSAIGTATLAGSSDAEVFSVQKTINNDFDDSSNDPEVLNQVLVQGDVLNSASGNAGANVAAGAFNAQKNALAVASVTGSATLSEATAAVLQESTFNETYANQTTNDVKLGENVAFAFSGNIGLNMTAGTNNLQQNTLAISSVASGTTIGGGIGTP